ncbi:nucleoside 2-deoxyribosyltransferase [Latilactobacillus sakei]|uniref:nucleoside 2-deoxyribosyltransferase n=1 Tax=Latilactobacillus sakei TaxID=1599 RepID=UPI003F531914
MQKQIYLAGGWFTPKQADMVARAHKALAANPTVGYIHSPQEHQYKDVTEDNDPNGLFGGYEWANQTYQNDITAMDLADMAVVLWDMADEDTGTAFEVGYLNASHTPIVFVCEDDLQENPINLMLAKGISKCVTDINELETLDFQFVAGEPYPGKIV